MTNPRRRCAADDCPKLSQGLRKDYMCNACYRAKTGAPKRKRTTTTINGGLCIGPECDRPSHCKQYCKTHYGQWLTAGRVWVIGSRAGRSAMRTCLELGCGADTVRWGFCEVHAVARLGACWVSWCDEPVRHQKLGLCDGHARQNRYIVHMYGIGMAERAKLSESQGHRCKICGEADSKGSLNIDHCHSTKKVRGLLCGNCNRAIGLFRDSPESLRNAAEYLEGSNGIP